MKEMIRSIGDYTIRIETRYRIIGGISGIDIGEGKCLRKEERWEHETGSEYYPEHTSHTS